MMPSLQEVVSKDTFQGLPPEEQKKVLDKLFPTYSGLPDTEKQKVLGKLSVGSPKNDEVEETTVAEPKPTSRSAKSIMEYHAQKVLTDITKAGQPLMDVLGSPGMERHGPRMFGAMGGAAAGSPLGPLGSLGGAMLGAAGGEGWRQAAKGIFGAPDAPKDSNQAMDAMGKAVIQEGITEAVGGLGGSAAKRILAPFANAVTPAAKKVMNSFGGRIKLTPAEATDKTIGARILDFAENVGERSIIGGGYISKFRGERDAIFDQIADEMIDKYGGRQTAESAGDAFLDIVSRKKGALKAQAHALYKHLDEVTKPEIKQVPVTEEVATSILQPNGTPATQTVTKMVETEVGGAKISTKLLKQFAKPRLKDIKATAGIGGTSTGDALIKDIMGLPDTITFTQAKELRTRLNASIDEFTVANKKAPAIGTTKKLAGLVNTEIRNGLKAFDQEALKEWDAINQFYRTNKKEFDNRLIRKMVKKADPELGGQPEKFAQALFGRNNIGMIKTVKQAVDEPTWEKIKSYYIQDLIQKSRKPKTDILSGEKLNKLLTAAGDDTLSTIFRPEQLKNIKKFAEALKITQAQQGGSTGKVWIELTQAGAPFTLLSGNPGAQAFGMTVLFAPPALARIMLNPKVSKYMTEGIVQLPKKSHLAGSFSLRLARDVEKMEQENKKYLEIEDDKKPNPSLSAL